MLTEDHEVLHSNDVVLIVAILRVQELQYAQLHAGLVLELLLVANDFDGDDLLCPVVEALDGLTEAALAKELFADCDDPADDDEMSSSSAISASLS